MAARKQFQSPAGTFERILKEVLEHPDLTSDEKHLLMYLATKPEGWKLNVDQVRSAVNMSRNAVKTARAGLIRRGYLLEGAKRRGAGGRLEQDGATLVRERVLAGYPKQPPAALPAPRAAVTGGQEIDLRPDQGKHPVSAGRTVGQEVDQHSDDSKGGATTFRKVDQLDLPECITPGCKGHALNGPECRDCQGMGEPGWKERRIAELLGETA